MTDKQMIIDGVDVSGCSYYQHNMCTATKDDYGDCSLCCQDYDMNDCYYKQLKRKEQECEELKSDLADLSKIIDCKNGTILIFKEQLDQLKADREEALKQLEFVRTLNTVKETEIRKLSKTLIEIKEITEPYKMIIKKICGNCKKYDDCHACCYKDINCYKYTSPKTDACKEFTYLDELIPNILANNILQKISECGVENDT